MFLDANDLIKEREEIIAEMKPIFLNYLISRCRIAIDNRELGQTYFEIPISKHNIITLFRVHYGDSSKLTNEIVKKLWSESFIPFHQICAGKGYRIDWTGYPFDSEKVGKIALEAKKKGK